MVSPHKSNPLVLQKILARIMLSEIKTSRLCIFYYLHVMSLPWKVVVVASRWLVKCFFLNSNDVLDAVLSVTCDQASLLFFSRREGTPDTITWLFVCRPPIIEISLSENVSDAISQLPEVASWAEITQGTNSVNLHAVLYSTTDKNMVYFVKHVLLFRS